MAGRSLLALLLTLTCWLGMQAAVARALLLHATVRQDRLSFTKTSFRRCLHAVSTDRVADEQHRSVMIATNHAIEWVVTGTAEINMCHVRQVCEELRLQSLPMAVWVSVEEQVVAALRGAGQHPPARQHRPRKPRRAEPRLRPVAEAPQAAQAEPEVDPDPHPEPPKSLAGIGLMRQRLRLQRRRMHYWKTKAKKLKHELRKAHVQFHDATSFTSIAKRRRKASVAHRVSTRGGYRLAVKRNQGHVGTEALTMQM